MRAAAQDYDATLTHEPGFVVGYQERGNFRMKHFDYDGAIADYTQTWTSIQTQRSKPKPWSIAGGRMPQKAIIKAPWTTTKRRFP